MQLTVRDASRLLNTLEETIYRWIRQGRLPAYRLQNRFRFNRAELLEWATSRHLEVSPDIFEPEEAAAEVPLISDALRAGGIFYRVAGADPSSVVSAVVAALSLPEGVDRDALASVFLTRATLDATAIGDGIKIPHVRYPVVLAVDQPSLSLHVLERPVDFGAGDEGPVWALFCLISPTVRAHLRLLTSLSRALGDAEFRAVLKRQGTPEETLSQLRRIETRIAPLSTPGSSCRS
jgi:nitrogen PTS system EIIA component